MTNAGEAQLMPLFCGLFGGWHQPIHKAGHFQGPSFGSYRRLLLVALNLEIV